MSRNNRKDLIARVFGHYMAFTIKALIIYCSMVTISLEGASMVERQTIDRETKVKAKSYLLKNFINVEIEVLENRLENICNGYTEYDSTLYPDYLIVSLESTKEELNDIHNFYGGYLSPKELGEIDDLAEWVSIFLDGINEGDTSKIEDVIKKIKTITNDERDHSIID